MNSFLLLYLLNNIYFTPSFIPINFEFFTEIIKTFDQGLINIALSLQFAFALVIAYRISQRMIKINDFLGLSKKPFSIGIAGDSASGKDTYVESLVGLFGNHSTTHLSGDDYHYWDRNEKIWEHLTHLDPKSND